MDSDEKDFIIKFVAKIKVKIKYNQNSQVWESPYVEVREAIYIARELYKQLKDHESEEPV